MDLTPLLWCGKLYKSKNFSIKWSYVTWLNYFIWKRKYLLFNDKNASLYFGSNCGLKRGRSRIKGRREELWGWVSCLRSWRHPLGVRRAAPAARDNHFHAKCHGGYYSTTYPRLIYSPPFVLHHWHLCALTCRQWKMYSLLLFISLVRYI